MDSREFYKGEVDEWRWRRHGEIVGASIIQA